MGVNRSGNVGDGRTGTHRQNGLVDQCGRLVTHDVDATYLAVRRREDLHESRLEFLRPSHGRVCVFGSTDDV